MTEPSAAAYQLLLDQIAAGDRALAAMQKERDGYRTDWEAYREQVERVEALQGHIAELEVDNANLARSHSALEAAAGDVRIALQERVDEVEELRAKLSEAESARDFQHGEKFKYHVQWIERGQIIDRVQALVDVWGAGGALIGMGEAAYALMKALTPSTADQFYAGPIGEATALTAEVFQRAVEHTYDEPDRLPPMHPRDFARLERELGE